MGVIAMGTGNDWVRTYGIPSDYEKAVEVIAAGKSFTQDVVKATYVGRSGSEESRYCVNVSGAGMDAAVDSSMQPLITRMAFFSGSILFS